MARNKFRVEVLTPEGQVFDDEVEMVSTRTTHRLDRHPGQPRAADGASSSPPSCGSTSESEIVRFAQGEGYLQVVDNHALVLVEEAIKPDDLDRCDFESRLKEAEQALEQADAESEERRRYERAIRRYKAFLEVSSGS